MAIEIVVQDDGKGFDIKRQNRGNGLGNMRRRVQAMGGRLTIESCPGQGTVVRLMLNFESAPPPGSHSFERKFKIQEFGVKHRRKNFRDFRKVFWLLIECVRLSFVLMPDKAPIKVAIVDDDEKGIRGSLAALIRRAPALRLAGDYPDAETALRENSRALARRRSYGHQPARNQGRGMRSPIKNPSPQGPFPHVDNL